MRTKVTLVLLFLNVALFFFIFKFERQWRTEAASLEARHRVLGAEATDIRSLEFTSTTPGGSFSLVRRGDRDAWLLTRPLDWPANLTAVQSIRQELQLLENETSFAVKDLAKSGQSIADFGLDKPKLTVAFTSSDAAAKPTVLSFGDTTKTGNRIYILSPDGDRIHVVNRTRVDSLMLPLDRLRADTLLTIPVFEAKSLTVQTATLDPTRTAGGTGVRVHIRRDNSRWTFDSPITARAGKAALEGAINDLNKLHPLAFVATNPPTLPSAAPTLRIGIEGNNRRETLFLGEPVAPPAAGRQNTDYYAQLEDRTAVFTVTIPNDLIETLRNAPEKLRDKHLLPDLLPAAVTAITLAAPVQPDQTPLTLQRLEVAANATTREGTWQIVRRGDAGPGLQTTPADGPTVQRLLARLVQLEAKTRGGFVTDNPSNAQLESWGFNRPERTLTLTFAPLPPGPGGAAPVAVPPVTLRLGTDANRNVYARVGDEPGASVYLVDSEIINDLLLAPSDWRDRQMFTMPAGSGIAALKLTDLATKQVLIDSTPDAAGKPTAAARDPEALAKFTEQLRAVRAQRFLPGGFAEKFTAAGTEREWRFQLDLTVAPPGGAPAVTRTLFFSERLGGAEQFAGTKDLDAIFQVEQPILDSLTRLTARDPGPPPAAPATPNAKIPGAK